MPILGIGRLFVKEKIFKREKLNVNGKMCTGSYQGIYWQKGRKKVCAKSKKLAYFEGGINTVICGQGGLKKVVFRSIIRYLPVLHNIY